MRNYLLEYSEKLATDIAFMCDALQNENNIIFQIKKSSSSIYANVREAQYGQSIADMISKFEIALKEANETEGWLILLFQNGKLEEKYFKSLRNLCGRIRRLLISSVKTLKAKA